MGFLRKREVILVSWVILGLGSVQAQAAAKKAAVASTASSSIPSCTLSNGLAISTPKPVRQVSVQPVGTKIFTLPNGSRADMSMDLNSILSTSVTSTSALLPQAISTSAVPQTSSGAMSLCDSHIELRSEITTFQLDIASLGISVGYSPGGAITSAITNATGTVTAQIGAVSMDFSLWQCVAGSCSAVVASTASHLTAGVNLNLQIDLSSVNTGSTLVYNTALAGILRSIMDNGMAQLVASARFNDLNWTAQVIDYTPAIGILVFDAGNQSLLAPNQGFEVYASTGSTTSGACPVYELVGYVHSTIVGGVSSYALVDQLFGSRGIQIGDLVMIRNI